MRIIIYQIHVTAFGPLYIKLTALLRRRSNPIKMNIKFVFSSSFVCVSLSGEGYCFNGDCPTLDDQCERIWLYGGQAADQQCYDQFNTKGSINGHCGKDSNGDYKKCEIE